MSMTPQSVRVLFFCIFILLLVLQSAYVPIRHSGVRALFVRSVLVAITSCLLYIGTYPGFFGADGIFLTRAFNGLYFAVTALLPWMWLVYMVRRVFIKPSLSTWIRILISLPVAFFAVASILSIGMAGSFMWMRPMAICAVPCTCLTWLFLAFTCLFPCLAA